EFAKHGGETLLGLGNGLGTDWVQYARHGASVIACSNSSEQLSLARRNFELRGLSGRFLSTTLDSLPVGRASIDVVCVRGFFDDALDAATGVEEVYRVLKPGGKVLAVTPARYDVTFWSRLLLPWRRWLPPAADRDGPVLQFSARRIRRLFGRFIEHR